MSKTVYWVPHTHWDREWYRSFQSFRARLVDTVDAVLDKLLAEPEFKFLLDGQTVILEDYLEIRPEREHEIRTAVAQGRLAIGPWYVQPDSLLPGGEAHIRNLLIGRAVGQGVGHVSEIAYTPDSFGHPAQFPQLFAGFGLRAFVYWRGNGNELQHLPTEYCWRSPDGSEITACLMYRGYFNGALLPADVDKAVDVLKIVYADESSKTRQNGILIMNGVDHAPPHPHAMELARGLAEAIDVEVVVSLLEPFVDCIEGELPVYQGPLMGARLANLLPGVWSARLPLKLANRHAETTLQSITEPLAAIASLFGLRDERASLRAAWKSLLKNQAHDSIGGCSIDRVHIQMLPRYFAAQSLADETAKRIMERLAGQGQTRQTPMTKPFEVAVFNPSPYVRSGVARLALDATPALASAPAGVTYHPILAANKPQCGYTADGVSVRFLAGPSDGRFFHDEHQHAVDLEIPVSDIPAFGYKRVVLQPSPHADEIIDDGISIGNEHLQLELDEQGTVTLSVGGQTYAGLMAVEDLPDRGDSYDADVLSDDGRCELLRCKHRRCLHPNGTQVLEVERLFRLPRELNEDRSGRGTEATAVRLYTDYILYPGSDELKLRVRLKNTAKDHRFRLLLPTAAPIDQFSYATTFDTATADLRTPDASEWLHPAPATFVHQGWVCLNGLTVVVPGLPEAQVSADGTLAITLLRSIGWLSRPDLSSRPGPAGPVIPVDNAQCLETIAVELTLFAAGHFANSNAVKAQQCEVPLSAVIAGPEPLLEPGRSLLALHSDKLVMSAFKPAEQGDDFILRLLNPGDTTACGELVLGFELTAVQQTSLDEQQALKMIELLASNRFAVTVEPHQLQTLRLTPLSYH